jgi:hypothetical protein
LRKTSKVLPSDIKNSFKISYDALDREEKQIFLDIACFFIAEDRDTAIRIWDGSGWEGSLGFCNVEYRCLVDVDSENCIRMHNHVRDLGRDLAKETPGCERRLWCPTDNLHHNLSGQAPVRILKLSTGFHNSVVLSKLSILFLTAPRDQFRCVELAWFTEMALNNLSKPLRSAST